MIIKVFPSFSHINQIDQFRTRLYVLRENINQSNAILTILITDKYNQVTNILNYKEEIKLKL